MATSCGGSDIESECEVRKAAIAVVGLLYTGTIFAWLFGLLPASQQCVVGDSGLGAMQCRILLHGVWVLAIGLVLMSLTLLASWSRDSQTAAEMERFAVIGGVIIYVSVALAWYIAYLGL